jgi:hypothetical protein
VSPLHEATQAKGASTVSHNWVFQVELTDKHGEWQYLTDSQAHDLTQQTGCTYSLSHGIPVVQFTKTSGTPIGALLSAARELHRLGYQAYDLNYFMTASEYAESG